MIRSAWIRPAQGARPGRAARAPAGVRRLLLLFAALTLVSIQAVAPGPATAQPAGSSAFLSVAETEGLARRVDYEGMPEAEAARIGPEGAARLVEMLADPEEQPHHARILLALGIWGGEGALEAMRDWAALFLNGGKKGNRGNGGKDGGEGREIDRDRFRAWQVLPFALGKLAHRDPRAVAELAACFDADAPTWSFRRFEGARLQTLERRAAVAALAETRLPEAERVLDAIARRAGDPALAAHVRAERAAVANAPDGGAR